MSPSRPYILRGLYDWLLDNDLTPHIVVDAHYPNVNVPTQFVEEGRIVLNINPSAVVGFGIENDALFFNARFSGSPMDVYVPIGAVLAIYARENGQGMGFGMEPGAEDYLAELEAQEAQDNLQANEVKEEMVEDAQVSQDEKPPQRPGLRIVK
ncbi:MAG: ClpXP protease specificity-enhancing factor [Pontibacterium sp.]